MLAIALAFPAGVRAIELAQPTPEERARCEALPDERARELCAGGYSVRALKFPDEAKGLGVFTSTTQMGIFRPKESGPFPAVLLLHTCAAPGADPQHLRSWVSRALDEGYVAFVVDSWAQRAITEICTTRIPGFGPIHMMVRSKDAYDALEHLRKFDFVDTSRVAAIGFSNGGRVSYLLGSKRIADMFAPGGRRFAATVAVYGQCFNREFGRTFLHPDVDRPLLSLLGELDTDGDPRECLPRLQDLKQKGVPVEWHVYPAVGHAWDQPSLRVARRVVQTGNSEGALFGYDAKATEDSLDRVFEFLGRTLKK